MYGILSRKITEYTVVYSVYIRFWPTLRLCLEQSERAACCPPQALVSEATFPSSFLRLQSSITQWALQGGRWLCHHYQRSLFFLLPFLLQAGQAGMAPDSSL
jgi:hypothetical protein